MRFTVIPAAYVFLLRGTQVLLQLRQGTGYRDGFWAAAAAGHVERGESVLAAAAREVAEELAITVDPGDLHPLTVLHRTGQGGAPIDERVDFFFTCRRWSGHPRIAEPTKAADLRWWPLDALPEPVVPHEASVLAALRAAAVPAFWADGFDRA